MSTLHITCLTDGKSMRKGWRRLLENYVRPGEFQRPELEQTATSHVQSQILSQNSDCTYHDSCGKRDGESRDILDRSYSLRSSVCSPMCSSMFLSQSHVQQWMDRVVTRPVLDVIRVLSTHWFCFCCGAVVTVPESKERVKDFANK